MIRIVAQSIHMGLLHLIQKTHLSNGGTSGDEFNSEETYTASSQGTYSAVSVDSVTERKTVVPYA